MAITKTIQATVKNRTDTAANWTSKNPVLAEGEIIVVQTSAGETRLKIGDGVKTFTQLPYTDEQIYNNIVTSVNGQTGDIIMNSVEYTAQTLTDEQKKQARDNIDAASNDFVINATLAGSDTCTLDKTYAQIREAVQAGNNPVVHFADPGTSGIVVMPLTLDFDGGFVFRVTFSIDDNYQSVIGQYSISALQDGRVIFGSTVGLSLDSDGNLRQVTMAKAPTADMQIATKKYVDDHASADVYVDFWPTSSEQYNGNFNGYQVELATDQTFDAIFDSIKAGNKIVARLYKDAEKSELAASSVDASVTGTKEFGAIHFQFVTANADTGAIAGFPFIGEAIMMIKWEEAAVSYLIENRNVLPTPNADGTDNGKVPIINGTSWELKTPTGGGSTNAVLYTPQTLTDEQKKQARNNVDAAIGDFSVTATIQNFPTCTLDKTFNQIQEAISKGKRVFAVIKFGGDGGLILPLFNSTSTEIQFTAFDYNNGLNRAQTYKLVVTTAESVLATGSAPMLTIDNTLRQVEMEAGPSFDMEIATKKYVDDKFSDKELILSSSTAGSTKKFKLTIDDTGTLTASEITA